MNSSARTIGTVAALGTGTAYLAYRSIPTLMTAIMKLQMNPPDEKLGQLIQEMGAPSSDEIAALGVVAGKSALVVGGTRGVGYGTALALAKSGSAKVTIVGRSIASGDKAVSSIENELSNEFSNSTKIDFLQGDIGTVASTQRLVDELAKGKTRYDYLIVTAAIFPKPKSQNPKPLNEDGIEKSFGIGVVGRFLLYRNAYKFMEKCDDDTDPMRVESPMILNVLAAGGSLPLRFNRELVHSLPYIHFKNILNFAIGNELMLHKLVEKDDGNSDGTKFNIPIITTHPGFLKTDLHRGQGLFMDLQEAFLVHFMGYTEYECGRREVSLLCAVGSKHQEGNDDFSLLSIVDNFGHGRLIGHDMEQDLKEHGDWLWNLLLTLEADN